MSLHGRAEELLRLFTGDSRAAFRDGQWEAIDHLVERRGKALVVQRTGWGKSAVYFIATGLLRDEGAGPTVLISPLSALMRNQVQMAERAGVRAATINGENRDDWSKIEAQVRAGEVDVLLISPERLNNLQFRKNVLPDLVRTVGLLVVGEAHCISDWGHDFRPDYRRISRVLRLLPAGVPVLCTTATANDRVVADIVDQLGDDLAVHRGPLDRESLVLSAVALPQQAQRLAWLATVLPTAAGVGDHLLPHERRHRAGRGMAALARDRRGRLQRAERPRRPRALRGCAARQPSQGRRRHVRARHGLRLVGPVLRRPLPEPGSPIAYYQQVGRAGRAVPRALGVLLQGLEDRDIVDYFITTAFPPKDQAERAVSLLAARVEPVRLSEIEAAVNTRRSRIEAMLKILEVEGAVEHSEGGWRRTLQPWTYDTDRVRRVTELRRTEQAAMAAYASTGGCRMQFLRDQLDDTAAEPCGRCDNCTGDHWSTGLDRELVAAAFLRSAELDIEPRQRWPAGRTDVRGCIAPEQLLVPGRALSVSADGGWGTVVRRGSTRTSTSTTSWSRRRSP